MKQTDESTSRLRAICAVAGKVPPWQILCIVLTVIAAYWGTLDYSFHFDDWPNIQNNPNIQISEFSLDSLKKAAFDRFTQRRPVAYISLALNHYVHGLEVRGYHVVNIIIHIITALLLYAFVQATLRLPPLQKQFAGSGYIPLCTALIWAAHPLQTQSVTYIVQRMNSMGVMFFMAAMLCYVLARTTRNKTLKYLLFPACVISGALAFGSKENTLTLPVFILLYEWYFLQDLKLRISRKSIAGVLAAAGLVILAGNMFIGEKTLSAILEGYDNRMFNLTERLLTQPRIIFFYLSLLAFPYPGRLNLVHDFPVSHTLFSPPATFVAALCLIGLAVLAVYLARNRRLYSFCILWFLGNLVIESSILPLELVFEHRLYLPSMAGALLAAALLHQTIKNQKVFLASLAAIVLLFSFWTHERNKVWENDVTLWSDCYKKSPNKSRTNQNLGLAYFTAGRYDEALPLFNNALTLYAGEVQKRNKENTRLTSFHLRNLGKTYKAKGQYQLAIKYYDMAQQVFFYDAESHFQLGQCYEHVGNYQKAVFHYEKAAQFSGHHSTDVGAQAGGNLIGAYLRRAQRNLALQQGLK